MSYSPLSAVKIVLEQIAEYVSRLGALASAVGVLSDIRVTPTGTVTVAGTVTATGTLTGVTTVSTVSSLTNQVNIGGFRTNPQIPALTNTEAVLSNISNIIIT